MNPVVGLDVAKGESQVFKYLASVKRPPFSYTLFMCLFNNAACI
ncbi:hypothetical protein [Peribacillus muralis]